MQTFQPYRRSILVLSLSGILSLFFGLTAEADNPADKNSMPPEGAIVLFNGTDLSGWTNLKGQPAKWQVKDGYMEVVPGTQNIVTKQKFGPDFQFHAEFWLPLMANATGQGRANSGIFLQGRYEIQVLDSYMNKTYANGACGALYSIIAPNWAAAEEKGQSEPKNPCRPPEQWQSYDITFHAPRVDSRGNVTKEGHITVVQNGVPVIDNVSFNRITPGELDKNIAAPGPIMLQDHGAKVRYRNLWLKPLKAK